MANNSGSIPAPVGPWGDEDCTTMLFRVCNDSGAAVVSELDALNEYCGIVEDWCDYALSVEGPLMYHVAPSDEDIERIAPCECEDDHPGQLEVWKVVSQQQEPTARARERKRIARWMQAMAGSAPRTGRIADSVRECVLSFAERIERNDCGR